MPPKWMLPDPHGIPMIVRSVERLAYSPSDLVITILEEHEARFGITGGLRAAFGFPVETLVLKEPTRSQSETVAKTLKSLRISEPFIIKDSDNAFSLNDIDCSTNYVSVASLNDFEVVNPRNKSYVTVDQEMFLTSIHEKKVVSDLFSVGGYFFRSPSDFLEVYERLEADGSIQHSEIYVSEIISYMIVQGETFKARQVAEYEDWGTVNEWRRKLESRTLFLVSVDGFLFERGFSQFYPTFQDVKPNPNAVAAVKHLSVAGHTIVYLSIRPQEFEAITLDLLESQGLPKAPILMGCDMSQWTLLTAPHASLPLVTSRAYELRPEDENIVEKLVGH